ncbi:MAG: ATP-binding protein [Gemmataceae bacterium]|nr:ATP-binding protein [Gemmataceae bacterium]
MADKQRFNLHLPGLLKVLAEHLYSTKKVGVRELIQNAHDSCIRRKVEGNDPKYRPAIRLWAKPDQRTLYIQDNGTGLTSDEIDTYLATIGRGYTRELREKLSIDSAAEAAELIGQFGLGFLSAFLLAEEVTLTTRSFRGGPALRWQSRGDEFYETIELPDHHIGSTVILKVKPAAAFVLREKNLVESVRNYADFLPIPIYVGDPAEDDEPEQINLGETPWEALDPDQAIHEFIGRSFDGVEPLWVLPLKDWKVRLYNDSSSKGRVSQDAITIPMQGFLFVPPGSVASVREYGDCRVYIRRMFICDQERDLLPPWARFVRGVVECPMLQPTASREGLHQDDNFQSVQQAIEEQLGEGLRNLSKTDPDRWRALVRGHSDVITSWAVKNNEFFEKVEDIVCFRTSRGLLSLPEYLDQSGGSLYYVTREMGSLQEQMLAEGRDVPAIDASWFAVTPFLEKYAARHGDVGLVQLDHGAKDMIHPVSDATWQSLMGFFRDRKIRAKVGSFKPQEVPALMVYPQAAEIVREANEALEGDELPGPLAGLLREYVDHRFSDKSELSGTLYLNASCPLIKKLAEQGVNAGIRDAMLLSLYEIARLFSGRMLNAGQASKAFGSMIGAMDYLVKKN